METKIYSFIDKSTWGNGEWQNEPDKVQWQDEETGLPCLAVRHPLSGHWCGYVGVDESHPLFNIGYSYGDNSPDSILEVHGGITFTDFCQEDGKEHGICHIPPPLVSRIRFGGLVLIVHTPGICPLLPVRYLWGLSLQIETPTKRWNT